MTEFYGRFTRLELYKFLMLAIFSKMLKQRGHFVKQADEIIDHLDEIVSPGNGLTSQVIYAREMYVASKQLSLNVGPVGAV